jgi:two-component system alkaline phosphatase synthesis response regulator PhoP
MLLYALKSSGFEAEGFVDGTSFFDVLKTKPCDLVLLDIMLPGEDGIMILKKIRRSSSRIAGVSLADIPVIMLTAKGAEYDKIKGLDLGADDYITKPFSVMEVISRIKAVLRRSTTNTKNNAEEIELSVGIITLNTEKRSVSLTTPPSVVEPVETTTTETTTPNLTYKEFELLACLMRNTGIVLSRDKLLEKVWGQDTMIDTRTVDMHIKTLRQKLGLAGGQIKTIRNVGYKIEVEQ